MRKTLFLLALPALIYQSAALGQTELESNVSPAIRAMILQSQQREQGSRYEQTASMQIDVQYGELLNEMPVSEERRAQIRS